MDSGSGGSLVKKLFLESEDKIRSRANENRTNIDLFVAVLFSSENMHEMFQWLAESATLSSKFRRAAPVDAPTTISLGKKFALAA